MAVAAEKLGQVAAVQFHQVQDRVVAGLLVVARQLIIVVKQEHLDRVIVVVMLVVQLKHPREEVVQAQLVVILQL